MKIVITESQYRRLITEDNKSFLDGMVNFPNIKNVIDPFIAKIFVTLKNDESLIPNLSYLSTNISNGTFKKIVREIMTLTDFTEGECVVLTHNYSSVYWDDIVMASETGDWKSLIGKPLEFYGKFNYPATVYHTGTVGGSSTGDAYGYARNIKEFIGKIGDGNVEIEDRMGRIDSDETNIDWEIDWDFTNESFGDEEIDYNDIEIKI
jgi:hypothetical protein